MIDSRRSRDMTKDCYFHEDHGHDNNDCHELRHHIKEAGDRKKENKETAPVKAPILMISRQDQNQKRKSVEEPINGLGEITFPPVSGTNNSSDPVIIKSPDIQKTGELGIYG
ncbi:hypothetical protein Tco_0023471 [Tanacetum coccineum]